MWHFSFTKSSSIHRSKFFFVLCHCRNLLGLTLSGLVLLTITLEKSFQVPVSEEEGTAIEVLNNKKCWIIEEFPDKNLNISSINLLLQMVDETGGSDCKLQTINMSQTNKWESVVENRGDVFRHLQRWSFASGAVQFWAMKKQSAFPKTFFSLWSFVQCGEILSESQKFIEVWQQEIWFINHVS